MGPDSSSGLVDRTCTIYHMTPQSLHLAEIITAEMFKNVPAIFVPTDVSVFKDRTY